MMTRNTLIAIISFFMLVSCGETTDVDKMKEKLETLKKEVQEKSLEIQELEKKIAAADPEFAEQMDKSVLVSVEKLEKKTFVHQIKVQGEVASRKNIQISPEAMGRVLQVTVEPGDQVRKGQTLIRLDNETNQNQIRELKTALDLATTMFEKQSKLWEDGVGTEVQYLEAKNRKESLESQLATAQSQLNKTYLKAPFTGRINDVNTRVGEYVQPGMPVVSMVSMEEMYLRADVSEDYINAIEEKNPVSVYFPSTKNSVMTEISAISYVINQANRTFEIEAKIDDDLKGVKPNQLAIIDLTDYRNEDALVVPTNVIQQDSKGDFVFVIDTVKGEKIAHKKHVETGKTFNGETEILKGLSVNDTIVTEGYRNVVNEIPVKIAK